MGKGGLGRGGGGSCCQRDGVGVDSQEHFPNQFTPPTTSSTPSPTPPHPLKKQASQNFCYFAAGSGVGSHAGMVLKVPPDHPKNLQPPLPKHSGPGRAARDQLTHTPGPPPGWGKAPAQPGRPTSTLASPLPFLPGEPLAPQGSRWAFAQHPDTESDGVTASASHPGTLPARRVPAGCPQPGSKAAPPTTLAAPQPLSVLILGSTAGGRQTPLCWKEESLQRSPCVAVRGKGHLPGVRTHPCGLLFRVLPRCSQLCVSPRAWYSLEVRRGFRGTCCQRRDRCEGHEVSTLVAGVRLSPIAPFSPAAAEIPLGADALA